MRTGLEYLESLRDGRAICVDGEWVKDVTQHPAFAAAAGVVSELFDLAVDPTNEMIYSAPETGDSANVAFCTPRSRSELVARRHAITTWARHSHGWLGRSPDHVASTLAAMAAHDEVFADGQRDFGANVRDFHRRVLAESLYVTYAITPSSTPRTAADDWLDEPLQVRVVEANAEGLVVRGCQMLATGAPLADELFVSCIKPLAPEDSDLAVSFAVPIATPGLKFYCRRPYAMTATSSYDYPLSARFDETDAVTVLDDVVVPWERVFIDRDVTAVRRQFFDTGAHVLANWQAQIRFSVKLQFLTGLAHKLASTMGVAKVPGVVERLGELASIVSVVEAATLAAEHTAKPDSAGMWLPGKRALYGAMGLQAELYPRVLAVLRELAGSAVLQMPANFADLTDVESKSDLDRYLQTPDASAEERVKLLKLVWDAVGSEFAGRHHQYEMFYAGAPFLAKSYAFRNYDFTSAAAEVDRFLDGYALAG